MTSTKIKIGEWGCSLAHPAANLGCDGPCPIIEITGTDGVPPGVVLKAYERCIVLVGNSLLAALDAPVPWHLIADARPGQIIRLELWPMSKSTITITYAQLKAKRACAEQLALFSSRYGAAVTTTRDDAGKGRGE